VPVAAFIGMYGMLAQARTLGLLYQRREEALDWV